MKFLIRALPSHVPPGRTDPAKPRWPPVSLENLQFPWVYKPLKNYTNNRETQM